ncbi:MAG TPA: plastocyanin/azurin family copper-binding protein [Ktedonobacterales bacterium]
MTNDPTNDQTSDRDTLTTAASTPPAERRNRRAFLRGAAVRSVAVAGVGALALEAAAWRPRFLGSVVVARAAGSPGPVTVNIINTSGANPYGFNPASLTVPNGTTVTWVNNTAVPHTSTSDASMPDTWDSGIIGAGGSYSFTFATSGTNTYHCNVHSYMHGTVIVS